VKRCILCSTLPLLSFVLVSVWPFWLVFLSILGIRGMIKGFIILLLLNENPEILVAPHSFTTVEECLAEVNTAAPNVIRKRGDEVYTHYLVVCGVTGDLVKVGVAG